MKNIITLIACVAIVVSFTACKDKNKELDPMAKISIAPAQGVKAANNYLPALEIVKQTTDIAFQNSAYPNEPYLNVGIADEQRDLVNKKIMMWGMWVIHKGKLAYDFIEAYDVVFVTREQRWLPIKDTVAYIPNAQLRKAEVEIKAAYDKGNYDEVYELFDKAYQFTPINGADWRALKAKGQN